MRGEIAFLLLLFCGKLLFCQESKSIEFPKDILEAIVEYAESENSEGANYEGMLEELTQLYTKLLTSPMNINRASREDLESLFILNDFQIESILDYRNEYGTILSLNELYQIVGIDTGKAAILREITCVEEQDNVIKINPKLLLKNGNIQLLLRTKLILEKQRGYFPVTKEEFTQNPDCRYLGSRGLFYSQLKYEYQDRIKATVTTEKDGGEKGAADYKSANLLIGKVGPLESLIIGDFSARFGQGLVLWNSFSINSSVEPAKIRKSGVGIVPYNSTDENLSLRGVAANFKMRRIGFSVMLSQRKYDARIYNGAYTSLLQTGLHNTTTTLNRKGSLKGSLCGMNFSFKGDNYKISNTTIMYGYNHPYGGRDSLRLINDQYFSGLHINSGTDFYWILDNFRIFGEFALDHTTSFAGLAGVIFSPGNKLEGSILIRNYSDSYYAPYAGARSRSGNPNNERGVTASISCSSGKYWKISSFVELLNDYHSFTFNLKYIPEKGMQAYLRLIQSQKRSSFRLNLTYSPFGRIIFANRVDLTSEFSQRPFFGVHAYHEATYESITKKLGVSVRLAAFSTPRWDLRIYSYERDLLYNFSTPVYYGKGVRWYINIHYTPFRSIDFWFKIASTCYLDREVTGQGLDLIEGPMKSEAKFQLRWRF